MDRTIRWISVPPVLSAATSSSWVKAATTCSTAATSPTLLHGGYGNDTLQGGAGADKLYGEQGDDYLDGGNGGDTYFVTGTQAGGWSKFNGFDTYADTGTSGTDKIVAQGGDVDIGLRQFSAANGIEVIDASAATGTVRLIGEWTDDSLDFRTTQLVGSNLVVDGAGGNDVIAGGKGADMLLGGQGNDVLVGGGGNDMLDGGSGSDLLLGSGTLVGGSGRDRFLLAEDDGSSINIRGGKATGTDGEADVLTLLGNLGALHFSATVADFDKGKDRLDLSQLLDGDDSPLNLDDLLIQFTGGNASIGFREDVHTLSGGEVDVDITLTGVQSLVAADFYFVPPSLSAELALLDVPLGLV
jgi:Ca2+-binding RTX toxin-like protein